ncbi:MAG: hypothetical protein ACKV2U_11415 [Bryobacteraceae bacterium]
MMTTWVPEFYPGFQLFVFNNFWDHPLAGSFLVPVIAACLPQADSIARVNGNRLEAGRKLLILREKILFDLA